MHKNTHSLLRVRISGVPPFAISGFIVVDRLPAFALVALPGGSRLGSSANYLGLRPLAGSQLELLRSRRVRFPGEPFLQQRPLYQGVLHSFRLKWLP